MAATEGWKDAGRKYLVNLIPLVVAVNESAKDEKVSMRGVGLIVAEMLVNVLPALDVVDWAAGHTSGEHLGGTALFYVGGRLAIAGLGMLLHEE